MKSYKLIGLTGTTGAGKSQVCKVFSKSGYAVIDADFLARKAVENPLVLNLLTCHFGEDIVNDSTLNRKLLGQRAFATKEKTALLNSITHPFISSLFIQEIQRLVSNGTTKIIFDAPQLFESKLNVLCDIIVSVIADEKIREKRIIVRDNIPSEIAKKRMSVQYPADFFIKNSDYIIENNSTLENLINKAEDLITRI